MIDTNDQKVLRMILSLAWPAVSLALDMLKEALKNSPPWLHNAILILQR